MALRTKKRARTGLLDHRLYSPHTLRPYTGRPNLLNTQVYAARVHRTLFWSVVRDTSRLLFLSLSKIRIANLGDRVLAYRLTVSFANLLLLFVWTGCANVADGKRVMA